MQLLCPDCNRYYDSDLTSCPHCPAQQGESHPNLPDYECEDISQLKLPGDYICRACGYIGSPKQERKGSFALELFLWFGAGLFFFISIGSLGLAAPFFSILFLVALIYSFWRFLAPRKSVCRSCEQPTMIPVKSPLARALITDLATKGLIADR